MRMLISILICYFSCCVEIARELYHLAFFQVFLVNMNIQQDWLPINIFKVIYNCQDTSINKRNPSYLELLLVLLLAIK
jgi:hypothetical protein